MTQQHRIGIVRAAVGLATAAVLAGAPPGYAAQQRADVPAADEKAVDEFMRSVNDYVALRNRISRPVKPLPREATPEQIDENQRLVSQGIVSARTSAKVGDIFHPAMQEYVRRRLAGVFSGPDGKKVRSSILDENPVGTVIRINGTYPDSIPLATMPPQVLEALPKLPKDVEYRFVGERLILFDSHAHLVIDYVERALPRV
jgi:hypothetical protein